MPTTARLSWPVLVVLLAVYATASVRYAQVWQNELTLWEWAVGRAPLLTRPRINLALAYMERRRFAEAQTQLAAAERLANYIPMADYQRRSAREAVRRNRLAIARLAESR